MGRTNRVSAVLTQANADAAMLKIKDAKTLIFFLQNLSIAERKKLRKMGPKSVDYVQDCRAGANQFPNALAADFPLLEFNKDVDLIKILYPIFLAAQSFSEGLSDTLMILGVDCMTEADEVYASLKIAAKNDTNAKAIVAQIAKRFAGQGKKKTTTP